MEIVSADIDWLTLIGESSADAEGIIASITEGMSNEEKGSKREDFASRGYRGYRVGEVSLGVKIGGTFMAIFSGGGAARAVGEVYKIESLRATRCDYQVTVSLPKALNIAKDVYEVIEWRNEARDRPLYIVYMESETGSTVYVNKRSGAAYLRVYDKSKDYGKSKGTVWRFEVEFKRGLAQPAWQKYLSSPDRPKVVYETVRKQLQKRYINHLPEECPGVDAELEEERSDTDNDRTLKWLKRSVYPAILRLSMAGKREEALDAIGVEEKAPNT